MSSIVSLSLSPSRAAAWLLLWLSMGPVAAGPVSDAAPGIDTGSIEAAPALSLSLPEPVGLENALPDAGAAPAASASAGTTPAITQQAAEIIREAQAGAAAADPPHAAHPEQGKSQATAAHARSRSAAQDSDDEGGLRDIGKAALDWFKQAVPWLRDEHDDDSADARAGVDTVEWSESPLDGGNAGAGRHADVVAMGAGAGAGRGPGMAMGYGSDAGGLGLGNQRNYVREFVDLLRMVFEHPMTWLVVALFVIGGFAISKFDRRPK
jgi:hypothetical protein